MLCLDQSPSQAAAAVASPQNFPRHHMRVGTPGSDTVNSPAPPPSTAASTQAQVRLTSHPPPPVQTSAVQQLSAMVRPSMEGGAASAHNSMAMPSMYTL